MTLLIVAAGLAVGWLTAYPFCAQARTTVVERPQHPDPTLLPAAAAEEGLSALVLSSIDYARVAPPDVRLRVVEDEPYTYLSGLRCSRVLSPRSGFSVIELRSALAGGGTYKARIALEWEPGGSKDLRVLRRFDSAAHETYLSSAEQVESRAGAMYGVNEVRSPIGIAILSNGRPGSREFLAYSAAVNNPLLTAPDALPAGPYDLTHGELMAVVETGRAYWLLSVEFEGRRYPDSLRLTENLARLVVCQLLTPLRLPTPDLLPYGPEFELPGGDIAAYPVDPTTADLAEQPADGCAATARPRGGYLPPCEVAAPSPATPYGRRVALCLRYSSQALCGACRAAAVCAEPKGAGSAAAMPTKPTEPPGETTTAPPGAPLFRVKHLQTQSAVNTAEAQRGYADWADPEGWLEAGTRAEPQPSA
jgi:hypothetical protein